VQQVASVPFLPYSYYRMALPYFQGIEGKLDTFQPDIIHVANPTLLGLFALSYARRRSLPAVTAYHTRYVSYFPYYGLARAEPLGWSFLTWFHNRFDMTYAPSTAAVQELRDHGVQTVELWERGLDTSLFGTRYRDDALRRRVSPDGAPILIFIGRLVREKDLGQLQRAAQILKARDQPFKLAFVGEGPKRAALERELPNAVFAGHQSGEGLARWYASADVFVFPSTTETFGNVVLEAFASGLPVVGVRAGGVQNLVQPGENGVLAAPLDPIDFADKLEGLLRNPHYLQRLRAGALRCVGRFDWGNVNRKLLASYSSLLSGAPSQVRAENGRAAASAKTLGVAEDRVVMLDRRPVAHSA